MNVGKTCISDQCRMYARARAPSVALEKKSQLMSGRMVCRVSRQRSKQSIHMDQSNGER